MRPGEKTPRNNDPKRRIIELFRDERSLCNSAYVNVVEKTNI